jgi:hypothetical protein
MSITARGREWEIMHSLWIGWTLTLGFLNWIAFFYIGIRARQRKWIFWGVFYLTPVVLALANPNLDNWLGDWTFNLQLVVGIMAPLHAFLVRKEYLLRLEALPQMKSKKEAELRRRVATETANGEAVSRSTTVSGEGASPALEHHDGSPEQAETTRNPSVTSPTTKPESQNSDTNSALEQVTTARSKVARISAITQSGDELDYRISSFYPFPIAFGFRSLMSIVDYRDLYREQLRIAENILAFLASVSLTLLREQDGQKAEIDLKEYWRSGISPGDWKDIVGRCSIVFAAYEDDPLALGISGLNIRSEKKGFGHDVAKLIQAKNDYKHDRGPTVSEDIAEASREVQERLKRCMEKLSFLSEYPIRQVEDFNVSRSGDQFYLKCLRYMGDHPSFPQEEVVFHKGLRRGDLFLDLDGHNWVPLYPFILPMVCSHCKARETYFIDLWDQRRGTVRMKSFERGHTMSNTGVAETLAQWNGQMGPSS